MRVEVGWGVSDSRSREGLESYECVHGRLDEWALVVWVSASKWNPTKYAC